MNWIDITISIIIALPTFFGFKKGFLRKILGIVGLILGFILAVRFYKVISDFLLNLLKSNTNWIPLISFLIIIAIVFSFSVWVARFIAGINSGTTFIDKMLGGVFGFLEGLIISSILIINLSYLNFIDKNNREASRLYPLVSGVAPAIFDKVLDYSPELKKLYEDYKKLLIPL